MKKLVFLTILVSILPLLFFSNSNTYAQTLEHVQIYEAKQGDSFYEISMTYGVSELELKKINDQQSVTSGEKLIIPEAGSGRGKRLTCSSCDSGSKGRTL